MATNLIAINVYQINQQAPRAITGTIHAANTPMYLPSTGLIVNEIPVGNNNPLSTGVYVYSSIQVAGNNTLFYSGLHAAQVQTLANA